MLKDDFHAACRVNQLSEKTEESYFGYVKQFIKFNNIRQPEEMNAAKVENFIKYLAVDRKLSLATQELAFNSLVFLFKKVLKKKMKIRKDYRVKRPVLIPDVLTKNEVRTIIDLLSGRPKLITEILYGCGMRKSEVLSLRILNIDLGNGVINIKQSKGKKDRIAVIPKKLIEKLSDQIRRVKNLYEIDIKKNFNGCFLPDSLENKNPEAAKEFKWQYLFPAKDLVKDHRKRWHLHPSTYDKILKSVVNEAGINKRIHAHTFRHSFATHLIEDGYDIALVQQLLGHSDIRTTMVYNHTSQKRIRGYESPYDTLKEEKNGQSNLIYVDFKRAQ
ncbi:MAG: integron integrase [Thermoplasmata archaeon]